VGGWEGGVGRAASGQQCAKHSEPSSLEKPLWPGTPLLGHAHWSVHSQGQEKGGGGNGGDEGGGDVGDGGGGEGGGVGGSEGSGGGVGGGDGESGQPEEGTQVVTVKNSTRCRQQCVGGHSGAQLPNLGYE